jgi:hypothetical protein
MASTIQSFAHLSDDELLATVKCLATSERRATAALLRSLMELDVRRLYLGEGYSSLFTYCTQALRLAEGAAYNRIEAARAAQRFPAILTAIEDGAVTLTAVRGALPISGERGAARSVVSWSITTCSRTRSAVRRRQRTSSYDVARTMPTRRRSSSGVNVTGQWSIRPRERPNGIWPIDAEGELKSCVGLQERASLLVPLVSFSC